MSATFASRRLLWRPRRSLQFSRHASTTQKASQTASETASKAKEATSNVTSKASEGLSKVSSSAGSVASGAASRLSGLANSTTGRVGRLVNSIQAAIPPTVYYTKVGSEMFRIVFQSQKMAPPTPQAFSNSLQPYFKFLRNPTALRSSTNASMTSSAWTPENVVSRVRNLDRAQLAQGGVVIAEVLGFFTVGEMLGRLKIIGYRGEVHHEH